MLWMKQVWISVLKKTWVPWWKHRKLQTLIVLGDFGFSRFYQPMKIGIIIFFLHHTFIEFILTLKSICTNKLDLVFVKFTYQKMTKLTNLKDFHAKFSKIIKNRFKMQGLFFCLEYLNSTWTSLTLLCIRTW